MNRTDRRVAEDETRVADVKDLRAFVLASDLRSLTAAAREMGESKATLSRRIARLESSLGASLLRRSPRGITITEDGEAYRARVGAVLELLGDANAAAAQSGRSTPSGQLRVSIPPGFADALAPHFAGFGERYPRVTLIIHSASRFVDLETERFDVVFRGTTRPLDSSLVGLRINAPQGEGILVASPAYLARHPAPRRPHELTAHRFLVVGDGAAPYALPLTRRGTQEVIEVSLTAAIVGSDLGFLRSLALAGAGITVLPRLNVQDALDTGQLTHVLPGWGWPDVHFYLLHRGGAFLPPRLRVFIEYMRSALRLERGRRGVAGSET